MMQALEVRVMRSRATSILCPHIPVTGYHLPDGQESSSEEQMLQGVIPAQLHPVEGIYCQTITLEIK